MPPEAYSQYVIFYEGEDSRYQRSKNRTYTLSMPRCWPSSLDLRGDLKELKDRYRINFGVAALLQIDLSGDGSGDIQYSELKEKFRDRLGEYWIFPNHEGMWSLPPEEMYQTMVAVFENDYYEIVAIWGDWEDRLKEELGF